MCFKATESMFWEKNDIYFFMIILDNNVIVCMLLYTLRSRQ